MKLRNPIWDEVTSFENLLRAAKSSLRHGSWTRGEGSFFRFKLEESILQLRHQLRSRTYKHGSYRRFSVYEPKQRLILAAPIRDRVVHHAIHDVVAPIIDRGFIFDSYACRKHKGTHRAIDRAQKFLRANDFFLHLDVRKFFPSIPIQQLKLVLFKHIHEEPVRWLFELIIDSTAQAQPPSKGAQLELFDAFKEARGLPIGNLTSQFLANLYLNELDQWVKHTLKCKYYLRYMDDFVLFGNDRQELLHKLTLVRAFCFEQLGLCLHEKGGIKRYDEGLGFLGFRMYRTHRRLKGPAVNRFIRRSRERLEEVRANVRSERSFKAGVRAWKAHARYGDTFHLMLWLGERYPILMGDRHYDE